MVKNQMGKDSSGKVEIKKEYCDGLDFKEGEKYEFWEVNDAYVAIEDESAMDLVEGDIHGAYIFPKEIVEKFDYYDQK